jgi:predicted MFS family arabinose efflux permease
LQNRSELKLLLGAVAAYAVGYLGANLMPFFVTALLDGTRLDEQAVGLLGSIELTALAIGSVVLAPWVTRLSRRKLAITGAAIAGCGFAASANAETFAAMAAGRLVIGIGAGIAIAAANAALASARDPDRMFALAYLLGGLVAAALMAGLPEALGPWGYRGGFLLLATVAAVALPFVTWVPHGSRKRSSGGASRAPVSAGAIFAMAAMLAYSLGEQAIYAFMGEVGDRAGIPLEQFGLVAAGVQIAGLAGAGLAGWLGTRLGRTAPLAIGIAVSGLSRLGFIYASSPAEFAAISLVWGLSFFFVSPYIMGAAADLDRAGGRWTVAVGAMANFGYAFGPGAAGSVFAHWGPGGLAVLAVTCSLAALAMIVPVALSQDRASRAKRGASPAAGV